MEFPFLSVMPLLLKVYRRRISPWGKVRKGLVQLDNKVVGEDSDGYPRLDMKKK